MAFSKNNKQQYPSKNLKKFQGEFDIEEVDSKTTGIDLNFEDEKIPESFLVDESSEMESLNFSESSLLFIETPKDKKEKKGYLIKNKIAKKENKIEIKDDAKSPILTTGKCKQN